MSKFSTEDENSLKLLFQALVRAGNSMIAARNQSGKFLESLNVTPQELEELFKNNPELNGLLHQFNERLDELKFD